MVAGALPAASAIAGIATSRTVHTSAPSAVPWRSRSTTNDADGADGGAADASDAAGPTLALPPLHTTAMPLVASGPTVAPLTASSKTAVRLLSAVAAALHCGGRRS